MTDLTAIIATCARLRGLPVGTSVKLVRSGLQVTEPTKPPYIIRKREWTGTTTP